MTTSLRRPEHNRKATTVNRCRLGPRSPRIGALTTGIILLAATGALIGCASRDSQLDPIGLDDINMAVVSETQQGSTFELAVPVVDDIEVLGVQSPDGLNTTLSTGETVKLTVEVAPDLQPGTYNLEIQVRKDQNTSVVNLPFTVTAGPADGSTSDPAG